MPSDSQNHSSPADFRDFDDAQILAECRLETFRGSGPGGQKRNKTSSAVRLVHEPTGLGASATESRSQAQNRAAALRRLRYQIALKFRRQFTSREQSLDVSVRGEDYLQIVAWVLDALAETGWSVSDAARKIGSSTAQLSAFLRRDEMLWVRVNQQRKAAGLKGLIG